MNIWKRIRTWRERQELPPHLRRGELGEQAARTHLRRLGLKLLVANFRSRRGEIDLVFRDEDCLVFVEVKTRSSEDWTRPAAAVNARKRRLLSQTALDYLRRIRNPQSSSSQEPRPASELVEDRPPADYAAKTTEGFTNSKWSS